MGLQLTLFNAEPEERRSHDAAFFHKEGCDACPLDNPNYQCKLRSPKMEATGAERPLVYLLGEGPGLTEDEEGEQFVGESGEILRRYIPREFRDRVRFNNTVNCRPPRNRNPEFAEIESCRPRLIADIERTQPLAILGFGNVPLDWANGWSGITVWRGRRTPIRVGKHVCWYYPLVHPAWLLRNGMPTEDVRMFAMDMKRAFNEIERLPSPVVHTVADAGAGVELLVDVAAIKKALRWALNQPAVGIDYETNVLRPYEKDAKILTVAVGTAERSFAFPIDHSDAIYKGYERSDVILIWKRFLEETQAVKAVHNLAFELEWTGVKFGRELVRVGRWEDTASQAVIIDERLGKQKPGAISLAFLVQQYFGFDLKALSALDRSKLDEQPLDRVLRYNAMDAKYHLLLWEQQKKIIEADGLQEPYRLALRRVPTVVLTQMKGLPVNQKVVETLSNKYGKRFRSLQQKIVIQTVVEDFKRELGREFKPGSQRDAVHVFWDMLKYSECRVTDKYSKKYKLSVEEDVLKQIKHPLAKLLIDYRKAAHQLSTYILPFKDEGSSSVVHPDGLIHAQFNTLFARTGRLSCDSPNLQNLPKRDEEAKEVRAPIEAPPGHVVVSIDWGQIEARVIAMFTKDKHFVKALWEEYDVHMEWAERLAHAYPKRVGGKNNLTDKKVMKTFRTDVKNQFTFPLFFGASLASASGYLSIPENVLAPVYRAFWNQFSGVKDWQEEQLKFYNEYGYVECLTGRRRHGPLSVNRVYNSPVQGTAAEIVLDAMSTLSEQNDPAMQPDLNIHDDLTWVQIPEENLERHVERALDVILKPTFPWINVPITAEVSVGPNWAELKDEGTFASNKWR